MDRFSVQGLPVDQEPDPLARSKAQRTVASYARGVDDCRNLLEILGLVEPADAVRRVCPTCGAVHHRQGAAWRNRFCGPACERT